MWVHVCILPFHALHQCNLIWRGGDVEGGGFALMDSSLNAIYGLLFLHLDCVTEAQRPEKQLLSLLMRHTHTHVSTEILNSIHVSSHTRRKEDRETTKRRLLDRDREIKEERGYQCLTMNLMQSILMYPVNTWIHLIQAGIKNLNNSALWYFTLLCTCTQYHYRNYFEWTNWVYPNCHS